MSQSDKGKAEQILQEAEEQDSLGKVVLLSDGRYDASQVRNRIVKTEQHHSSEINPFPWNPRKHPQDQKAAMAGIMNEVGILQELLCYYSPSDGKLYCLDGHMRFQEFDRVWDCKILDLTDEEAAKVVISYDGVGRMAQYDETLTRELEQEAAFEDAAVNVMIDGLDTWGADGAAHGESDSGHDPTDAEVPEMELSPYEFYDSALILASTVEDWNVLAAVLGLSKRDCSNNPKTKKIGLSRAVPAAKFIANVRALQTKAETADELLREVQSLRKIVADFDSNTGEAEPEHVEESPSEVDGDAF